MSDKSWKKFERVVGRYFGVMRQVCSGTMGRHDQTESDIVHPTIFLEAKRRKEYAAVIKSTVEARNEAKKLAKDGIKVGVLVFAGPPLVIAFRSEDILTLAEVIPASGAIDPKIIHQKVNKRLRDNFEIYDKAVARAIFEEKPHVSLAMRTGSSPGFTLVCEPATVRHLADWHIAAAFYVASFDKGLTRDEKAVIQTQDAGKKPIADYLNLLRSFKHGWRPPKPKRKRTKFAESLPGEVPTACAEVCRDTAGNDDAVDDRNGSSDVVPVDSEFPKVS